MEESFVFRVEISLLLHSNIRTARDAVNRTDSVHSRGELEYWTERGCHADVNYKSLVRASVQIQELTRSNIRHKNTGIAFQEDSTGLLNFFYETPGTSD